MAGFALIQQFKAGYGSGTAKGMKDSDSDTICQEMFWWGDTYFSKEMSFQIREAAKVKEKDVGNTPAQ